MVPNTRQKAFEMCCLVKRKKNFVLVFAVLAYSCDEMRHTLSELGRS